MKSILIKIFLFFTFFFGIFYTYANEIPKNISSFSLESIKVISINTAELSFNTILEDHPNAIREFKIINSNNNLQELGIQKSELKEDNHKKLIIHTDGDFELGSKYELRVIDIKSANGSQIESGINGIVVFNIPQEFALLNEKKDDNNEKLNNNEVTKIENTNHINENELISEVDINNQIEILKNETQNKYEDIDLHSGSLAGIGIASAEKKKDIISESDTNKKLPTTGPNIIMFLICIFTFIGTYILFRFKS